LKCSVYISKFSIKTFYCLCKSNVSCALPHTRCPTAMLADICNKRSEVRVQIGRFIVTNRFFHSAPREDRVHLTSGKWFRNGTTECQNGIAKRPETKQKISKMMGKCHFSRPLRVSLVAAYLSSQYDSRSLCLKWDF